MPTYFAFSDECGAYQKDPTPKQLSAHPFYIRATLLIDADEWKSLSMGLNDLKKANGIPQHYEVKWADLWQIKQIQQKGQIIRRNEPLYFLSGHSYQSILKFVNDSLALLDKLAYRKIIITFTDNVSRPSTSEYYILSFHIQELMQRIEMEVESLGEDNLAVLFFDPVSEIKNNMFREIYFDFYRNGDFIKQYKHIKDSLNIEYSHQSCGIQIADYIAGAFSSVLKSNSKNNYKDGVEMYFKYIHPYLRKNWVGNRWGYGLREVPRSRSARLTYGAKIQLLKLNYP